MHGTRHLWDAPITHHSCVSPNAWRRSFMLSTRDPCRVPRVPIMRAQHSSSMYGVQYPRLSPIRNWCSTWTSFWCCWGQIDDGCGIRGHRKDLFQSEKLGFTCMVVTDATGNLIFLQLIWEGATRAAHASVDAEDPKIIQDHQPKSHFQNADTIPMTWLLQKCPCRTYLRRESVNMLYGRGQYGYTSGLHCPLMGCHWDSTSPMGRCALC